MIRKDIYINILNLMSVRPSAVGVLSVCLRVVSGIQCFDLLTQGLPKELNSGGHSLIKSPKNAYFTCFSKMNLGTISAPIDGALEKEPLSFNGSKT